MRTLYAKTKAKNVTLKTISNAKKIRKPKNIGNLNKQGFTIIKANFLGKGKVNVKLFRPKKR